MDSVNSFRDVFAYKIRENAESVKAVYGVPENRCFPFAQGEGNANYTFPVHWAKNPILLRHSKSLQPSGPFR